MINHSTFTHVYNLSICGRMPVFYDRQIHLQFGGVLNMESYICKYKMVQCVNGVPS